jgi:two-component system chemotaxis sensor kinase CheA
VVGSIEDNDSAREDFLSEAQEIVETLSRDLLLLEQAQKEGRPDPDLLNDVFRAVHTLKGLAGMFGLSSLSQLAHTLENLLDDLRLGRVDISHDTLDVLFDGVERIQRLLATDDDSAAKEVHAFADTVGRVSEAEAKEPPQPLGDYEIPDGVLSVLTEYEEHRLKQNVAQGLRLYRLRVSFTLSSIDTALEDLKARARSVAELITYLPSMGGGSDDIIELEVLLASRVDIEQLREALCSDEAVLEELPRKRGEKRPTVAPSAPQPPAPQAAAPARVPSATPRVSARDEGAPKQAERRASVQSTAHRNEGDAPGAGIVPDRAGGADALSLRSVANTVRVNIGKLDHLMNVVGELAIVRGAVAQVSERLRAHPELRGLSNELHRIARGFDRNLTELQDGILDVRMVPLGQVFDKLARVVRQTARDAKKEIRLEVKGAETEVDKLIVEELSDPLMHLIRNAIDHGVELPEKRLELGKSAHGVISLVAYQKGNHVLIDVTDDGAGMDPERLKAKAIERGILSTVDAEDMTRDEAFNLVFTPGFTTSDVVTDLSGRGVGMDVVKTNISKLGGVVDLHSVLGKGTTITVTLPITLAIMSALLVRAAGQTYAIPLANVQEALLLDPQGIRTVEGREMMTLRGGSLPLCRIKDLFRLGELSESRASRQYVVVSQLGARRLGLVVDLLLGQQDIVIKSLGRSLSHVRGFAGATDLADQSVGLVIDTAQILEEVLQQGERGRFLEMTP